MLWLWQQPEGVSRTPGLPSYSRMLSGADLWDHGHEVTGGQNHTVGKNESQSQSRCQTRGVRAVPRRWPRTLCADGSQGPSWSPSKWTLPPGGCSESPHVLPMSCQKGADASTAVEWWSGQGGACPHPRWGPGRREGEEIHRGAEQGFCDHALIMGITSKAIPLGSPL